MLLMYNDSTISTIAQILILVLILPLLLLVIDGNTFINLVQGIPICDAWAGMLYQHYTVDINSVLFMYLSSFFESFILGIFVSLARWIMHEKGLKILSTFLGLLCGSVVIKIFGVNQSLEIILYIIVFLVGIFLLLKSVFSSLKFMSTKGFLVLIIDSILSVILCGYVIALALLEKGYIGMTKLVSVFVMTGIALVIAAVVDKCVSIDEKKLKERRKIRWH